MTFFTDGSIIASELLIFVFELPDNFIHFHDGILLPDHFVFGFITLVLVHCDYFVFLLFTVFNLFA